MRNVRQKRSNYWYDSHVLFPSFTAGVVSGAGRGKGLGTPTINLDPSFLSTIGREGIYACWATIEGKRHPAVMHAGARPVFQDSASIEIHLLDTPPESTPETVTVEPALYLREIRDFSSIDELKAQIADDIRAARATLGV